MSANPFLPLLRHIRKTLGVDTSQSPDAQLLDRFVLTADESAFAALVERHGPMVWGVCQRVTGDAHGAEDAFQATWLVLTRKARSVRDGTSLPAWLCRVAFRLSLAARSRPVVPLEDRAVNASPADEADRKELPGIIDEEVNRLPQKYRLPVVLCFFQGRTHAEAAAELGWPVGTVAGRLARAKDMLHARLTRRGLAPMTWPLPLAGAMPAVSGTSAGGAAVALATAFLATETKRRLVGAGLILLLSCLCATACVVAGLEMLNPRNDPPPPPPVPVVLSPAARIPPARIRAAGVVALSPDDKWVAGVRGGRLHLFDWRTNRARRTLDGEVLGPAIALTFSPDGKWLAGIFSGGPSPTSLKVWNLGSGKVVNCSQEAWGDGRAGINPPSLVGFVPGDDKFLSAHIGDPWVHKKGEMHLWDARTGARLGRFPGGIGSLSPDGKTLATWDFQVTRLWKVSTGEMQFNLGERSYPFFHPDGETVMTAGADNFGIEYKRGTIDYFNRKTGTFQSGFVSGREAPAPVDKKGMLFSPDGKIQAEINWIMGTRRKLRGPAGPAVPLPFTDLYTVRTGKKLHGSLEEFPIAFSPDSKTILTGGGLYDVESGRRLWVSPVVGHLPVLFTRDGNTLISAGGVLWDAKTGRQQGTLTGYKGGRLAFSRDSKTLVSVSEEQVTLWVVQTGEKRTVPGKVTLSVDGKSLTFGQGEAIDLAKATVISPDGKTRLSMSLAKDRPRDDPQEREKLEKEREKREKDGVVNWGDERAPLVYDVEVRLNDGREVWPEGNYQGVTGATFSPDGKYLALGFGDGIWLWDLSPPRAGD